ncbi:MAG: UDP-2,3-diacylglucosamine diphosphatase [Steroidobacteraceae bacterium]
MQTASLSESQKQDKSGKSKPALLRVRTVFISDVHLGSRGCSAEYLLDFLHSVQCDTLYLVGDIVDLWSMKRSFFWPQAHTNVIRTILGKAKHGTRVIYIPGNHDAPLREHVGMQFGNVEIMQDAIHQTADGRRFWVLHGDDFDNVIKASPLLSYVGHHLYDFILWLNRHVNNVRRRCGFSYWSVAAFLKHRMKDAVKYIANYERALSSEARKRGVDGVICGHIHRAEITQLDDVLYCNDGDWVESCTTLIEDHAGNLSLLRWTEKAEVMRGDMSMPLLVDHAA